MPKRSMWRVAQFDTLRLRLIKIAARVVEMKTMIRVRLPTSCPAQDILRFALGRIPRLVTCDRRGMRPQTFTDVPSTRKPPHPSDRLRLQAGADDPRPKRRRNSKKSPEPSLQPCANSSKRCIKRVSSGREATNFIPATLRRCFRCGNPCGNASAYCALVRLGKALWPVNGLPMLLFPAMHGPATRVKHVVAVSLPKWAMLCVWQARSMQAAVTNRPRWLGQLLLPLSGGINDGVAESHRCVAPLDAPPTSPRVAPQIARGFFLHPGLAPICRC